MHTETYLRLLAESELRRSASSFGSDSRAQRLWQAATTLTAVDALDEASAHQVIVDFEAASDLRTGAFPGVRRASDQPLWTSRRPTTAAAGTHEAIRAVTVDQVLRLAPRGDAPSGELRLLGAVVSPSGVTVAAAARWSEEISSLLLAPPRRAPGGGIDAVDQDGHVYRCDRPPWWERESPSTQGWWDGHLQFTPGPPAGTRWLEVGTAAERVRIDLTAAARSGPVSVDPGLSCGPGSRMIDLIAESLLLAARSGELGGTVARAASAARTLTDSGAVPATDPAVARLAALGRHLDIDVGVRPPIQPAAAMPVEWENVLATAGAWDGVSTTAAFAYAVPQLDDAAFALTGLRSGRDGAALQLVARGWEARGFGWLSPHAQPGEPPPDPTYTWQVRDDTGRRYLISSASSSYGKGIAYVVADLVPGLPPAATVLEVVLTAPATRTRVAVPLDWRAAE